GEWKQPFNVSVLHKLPIEFVFIINDSYYFDCSTTEHHSMKLIGGNNSCSGRVQLQRGDKSGTICDYYWHLRDADVLCGQLDCGFALSTGSGAQFRKETGLIWKTNFNCLGNESLVWDCPVSFWEMFSCTHDHDVSVVCSESGVSYIPEPQRLPLTPILYRCDGRVEIYHDGTWGRLLDDSWNISNADVICRQLNFGSAISVYNSSQYGEVASSSRTSRDVGVLCSGECTLVINNKNPCKFQHRFVKYLTTFLPFGSFCSSNDVETPFPNWKRVVFLNFETDHKQLRLVDDGSSCSGTVEVYRLGDCRRVRDQFWDLNDANMVCRQLGCGPAIRAYSSPVYREGEWSPWLKDVQCQGNETNLLKCKPSRRNQSTENMSDVGVQCSKDTHIRLMDGGSSCAGRVEIYYNATWGTVCDDSWGSLEADVVCKQLGCGSAVDAIFAAPCGSASGQVWLDEVRCSGKESALWECASSPWGQHDCGHKEDVSIVCSAYLSDSVISALTDESDVSGVHGTVCSDFMGIELMGLEAAEVICKQLDCGSGPIWLDDIACNSNESFLWQCSSPPWGEHNCDHREDVGVICSGNSMLLNAHFGVNI
uniref:SRCR domain-containing protein n=1 Tax=Callorhinchus milii TaxID=7868 RepID=A0A4W3GRK3_CALMI